MSVRLFTLGLAALLSATSALAQEPPAQETPQAGGGRGGRAAEPEIRPYDRVITKDAKSDDGVFTVHRIKDRVYYEIPKDRLGREFLWVSQIAKHDARRRLRRPGRRQPRRQVGAATATASSCAPSRTTSSPTASAPIARRSRPRTTARS